MKREPIAIVGMGCRLPGGIGDPRDLWRLLEREGDAIADVPANRWSNRRFHRPGGPQRGKIIYRQAGFIDGHDQFDAEFFGVPPAAAAETDPQHRLLLEVSWEALEDAGLIPAELAGQPVGVFMGLSGFDYALVQFHDLQTIGPYSQSNTKHYMAPNTLSYFYDFRGPSIAVDAACSTALSALDLACHGLWEGRCDLAMAGGVNLLISPHGSISFSQLGSLSPDGRCKAFDASANGYVRSEGCVVVVLKPLAAAQRDGDRVYALVRATATNHGGYNPAGWSVPSVEAQRKLLLRAYDEAGVRPSEISYIEAHGTGTIVGDKIEATALGAFLATDPTRSEPLAIGSVKSNIGHAETAAGLAGLCKVALMLEQRKIPASIHFRTPNPNIPFEELRLKVAQGLTAPSRERSMIAGVNSFGIGGTNVHVVLEEPRERLPAGTTSVGPLLVPYSAHSPEALRALLERHHRLLTQTDAPSLNDLTHTLAERRTHHERRVAFVAASREELAEQVARAMADPETGAVAAEAEGKLVFVFTGMGPQWWGMGVELLATERVFRETLERYDELWRPRAGWSLLAEMTAGEAGSRFGRATDFSMAGNIALQVALASLWRSFGVVPDLIVGHSVGEVAAAYAAGILDLPQTVELAAARTAAAARMIGAGTMAAVGLPAARLEPLLERYRGRAAIGAINSPRSVSVTGEAEAIREIVAALGADVFSRVLDVDVPFHSPQIRARHEEIAALYPEIRGAAPQIPFFSSVTGAAYSGPVDRAYWLRNFEDPVFFSDAVTALAAAGASTFLEVGPHPVLGYSIGECLTELGLGKRPILPTLKRQEPEQRMMLSTLGKLYQQGLKPRWRGLGSSSGRRVALPTYPFQRRVYWNEGSASRRERLEVGPHPLLGPRIATAKEGKVIWEQLFYPRSVPYLEDHRIGGELIFPGAAYLEMALAAVAEVEPAAHELREVRFHRALALDLDRPVRLQLILDPIGRRFEIHSSPDQEPRSWTLHAGGAYAGQSRGEDWTLDPAASWQPVSRADFYRHKRDAGYQFGETFQTLQGARGDPQGSIAEVALPARLAADTADYRVHPVLLDAMFQAASLFRGPRKRDELVLPVGVDRVRVLGPAPARGEIRAGRKREQGRVSRTDLRLVGADGQVGVELEGFAGEVIPRPGGLPWTADDWLYEESWVPAELPPQDAPRPPEGWLIAAAASDPIAAHLAERLAAARIDHGADWPAALARHPALGGVVFVAGADRAAPPAAGAIELHRLLQAILRSEALRRVPPKVVVVTQGACAVDDEDDPHLGQAPLWGLARVARAEHPELGCRTIDHHGVDPAAIAAEITSPSPEPEVAWRGDRRLVFRLARHRAREEARRQEPPRPSADLRITLARPGSFEGLAAVEWRPPPPGPGQVQIAVHSAALNFRDVMKLLGIYPVSKDDDDALMLGDECSGRVTAVGPNVASHQIGDLVIARHAGSCLASAINLPAEMVFPLPAGLELADGATIPVVFSTVVFALGTLGRLAPKEKLLIHSAAGGVGLAAVQYAQHVGAEIFATAGTEEKRRYLRGLGIAEVMDSRSLDFADRILERTGGRGVDVVLNSLRGAAIGRSLQILAPFGRFLEIGKRDIFEGTELSLLPFHKSLAFHSIDLARLWRERPAEARSVFGEVLELFRRGVFKPLPRTELPAAQAEQAFRALAQAKEIGKVTVRFEGERAPATRGAVPRRAKDWLLPGASYLITGGLGGLGLALAEWLVERGAKRLVLLGRSAPQAAARARIAKLEAAGAEVRVARADVAQHGELAAVLAEIDASGRPLRGVFHLAGTLRDGLLDALGERDFTEVMAPKAQGAWNLHQLTADRPLDFFVMFSSASGVSGNRGQANYAAANRYLDALAQHRRRRGLPALSIAWGLVEAGMGADRELLERSQRSGRYAFTEGEVAELCGRLLEQDRAQIVAMIRDWRRSLTEEQGTASALRYALLAAEVAERDEGSAGAGRSSWRDLPPPELEAHLIGGIAKVIARVAGLRPEKIGAETSLADVSLDSLMKVELVNWMRTDLGVGISQRELKPELKVRQLAQAAIAELGPAEVKEPAPRPSAAPRALETVPLLPVQWSVLLGLERRATAGQLYGWYLPVTLEGRQPIDPERVRRAMAALIARYDALRLCLRRTHDDWLQWIAPADRIPIEVRVRSLAQAADPEAAVAAAFREELWPPWDPGRGEILRAAVLQQAVEGRDLLVLGVHHVAVDFFALRAVGAAFYRAYHQLVAGRPIDLPGQTNFAGWARYCSEQLAAAPPEEEQRFWRSLETEPSVPLPVSAGGGGGGDLVETLLPASSRQRLRALARDVYQLQLLDLLYLIVLRGLQRWAGGNVKVTTMHSARTMNVPQLGDLADIVGFLSLPTRIPAIDPALAPREAARQMERHVDAARRFALRASNSTAVRDNPVLLNALVMETAAAPLPEGFVGEPHLAQPFDGSTFERWRTAAGELNNNPQLLRLILLILPDGEVRLRAGSTMVAPARVAALLEEVRRQAAAFIV